MTKLISVKKTASLGMDAAKIGLGTVVGGVVGGPIGAAVGSIAGAQMADDSNVKGLVTAIAVMGLAGIAAGFIGNALGGGDQ